MRSLAAILKFCGQREVWNQDLSVNPRVFSFSSGKTLGTRWRSLVGFSGSFRFPTIYDCISSRHFSIFERRTSMQPKVELFPFLIWNRIRAYWKSWEAQITKNSEGYPFPQGNYKQNRLPGFSFTPYISALRQNLLWLVWPTNLSVFAKTPSERMFLFSVFLSLLPVKV